MFSPKEKETQTFRSAPTLNGTGGNVRGLEKKLVFECLCQIVSLCLCQIDAGNDDFPAGERNMTNERLGKCARQIFLKEIRQTGFDFLRIGGTKADIMQSLLTRRAEGVKNIKSVIRPEGSGGCHESVLDMETVLEINASRVVQVAGNCVAVRFRPVTVIRQCSGTCKIATGIDVSCQSQSGSIFKCAAKVGIGNC